MIHKSILIIGMSFVTTALYGCKESDSNTAPDLQQSEKEKSYIHVSMVLLHSDSLSTVQINEFSFTVTVKCLSTINKLNAIHTITNLNAKIPVATGKNCSLIFDSFEKGLDGNKVFHPHLKGIKLTLRYMGAIQKITQSDVPGHYDNSNSENPGNYLTHRYVNGSGENNSLKLEISSSPMQKEIFAEAQKKVIKTTEKIVTLNYSAAPKAFPLQVVKMTFNLSGTDYFIYRLVSTETSWPKNCKIFSKKGLKISDSWFDIDRVYKGGDDSSSCKKIILMADNNWQDNKNEEQLIILASSSEDTQENAYRVITIPALD